MKKILALISLLLCVLILAGCASVVAESNDLMNGIKSQKVSTKKADHEFLDSQYGFATELFKKTYMADKGNNTLVSPLSVMLALSMTANGADSETLSEMEKVLGQNIPLDSLNEYLKGYTSSLPNDEGGSLKIANSIWLRNTEGFEVKPDFLQKNANFYSAAAFKTPFDNSTVKEINAWVKKNTDGMIKDILDSIPDSTMMYIINALCFKGEWEEIYEKGEITKRPFTDISGVRKDIEMMCHFESDYLEDDTSKGFIKYYKGRKYAFAALLPDGNIEDYISSLSAEKISGLLANQKTANVYTQLPKFSYDYTAKLNDILGGMGMEKAFDPKDADFSRISDTKLFISNVLHKTFIKVDERGTEAGAITMIAADGAAMMETKEVILDRPFVYMIIDLDYNLPIFLGAVTHI